MEPQRPPRAHDLRRQPAWPLGCVTAFFGLLLSVNLLGLTGIAFAASGLPPWMQWGGPVLLALMVPGLMLVGGLLWRRRNPYGARVLLWACLSTVVGCAVISAILNLINWLTLASP